jgi:hypothetical protein
MIKTIIEKPIIRKYGLGFFVIWCLLKTIVFCVVSWDACLILKANPFLIIKALPQRGKSLVDGPGGAKHRMIEHLCLAPPVPSFFFIVDFISTRLLSLWDMCSWGCFIVIFFR